MNKLKQQITDADRIDALEKYVRSEGPLLLHASGTTVNTKGFLGLGFWDGLRDLRQALDVLVEADRRKESGK